MLLILSGCGGTADANPTLCTLAAQISESPTEQTNALIALSAVNPSLMSDRGLGEFEKITLENASRLATLAVIGEGDYVDEIAVSPDGKLLAVTSREGVVLYDASSGGRYDFFSNPRAC